MKNNRYFDTVNGWGEIILETTNYIVVKWDRDPYAWDQIPKQTSVDLGFQGNSCDPEFGPMLCNEFGKM